MENTANPRAEAVAPSRPSVDDPWNQQMMNLLRSGAAIREVRERARSSEDEVLARRQSAAILALVRAHSLPRAKHHALRPTRRPSPEAAEVLQ